MKTTIAGVTLECESLCFDFPAVHPDARCSINFMRTLRIPDDERDYPLPPGLGEFPLRPVELCKGKVPGEWMTRGGVVMPMYQAEAMWLNFDADYPCAIKIAAGKINAVTGKQWRDGLNKKRQNYVVVPEQPWLDGFCVAKGIIRQFVAMPLGAGYSAEEQITGEAAWGGLQLEIFPMRRDAYKQLIEDAPRLAYSRLSEPCPSAPMGLAPGGRMVQDIDVDPYGRDVWDTEHGLRCFVHIVNSAHWLEMTGEAPPHIPPTAADYTQAGLPWFAYYDENASALNGAGKLAKLTSLEKLAALKHDESVKSAKSCNPKHIVQLQPKPVSQGSW
jgi:hypothetical protein